MSGSKEIHFGNALCKVAALDTAKQFDSKAFGAQAGDKGGRLMGK